MPEGWGRDGNGRGGEMKLPAVSYGECHFAVRVRTLPILDRGHVRTNKFSVYLINDQMDLMLYLIILFFDAINTTVPSDNAIARKNINCKKLIYPFVKASMFEITYNIRQIVKVKMIKKIRRFSFSLNAISILIRNNVYAAVRAPERKKKVEKPVKFSPLSISTPRTTFYEF